MTKPQIIQEYEKLKKDAFETLIYYKKLKKTELGKKGFEIKFILYSTYSHEPHIEIKNTDISTILDFKIAISIVEDCINKKLFFDCVSANSDIENKLLYFHARCEGIPKITMVSENIKNCNFIIETKKIKKIVSTCTA